MFSLSSLTSRKALGLMPTRCRLFSTSPALSMGSFFDLRGLGASREAQYLSKQHGIPRTEFSANTHLIRSGEVHPSAAEAAIPDTEPPQATTARDSLAIQLQLVREELAQTKSAYSRLQVRTKGLETALMLVPALVSMIGFIAYQVYCERLEQPTGAWQSLSNPLGAKDQRPGSEDYRAKQAHRDATVEELALAESGLTSFETHPITSASNGSSIFSGFFWAKD